MNENLRMKSRKMYGRLMQRVIEPAAVERLEASLSQLASIMVARFREVSVGWPLEHASAKNNWVFFGVDWIFDENGKPWLTEVNTCPGAFPGAQPMGSMLRIAFTHLQEQLGQALPSQISSGCAAACDARMLDIRDELS